MHEDARRTGSGGFAGRRCCHEVRCGYEVRCGRREKRFLKMQRNIFNAVRATARTGVEMEALTGATVAALTVYDMCKALSHAIELRAVKLVGKRGGKRDVGRAP